MTLIETITSLALIAMLVAILLPALTSARTISYKETCSGNQRLIGNAWQMYLDEHNGEFPYIPNQPGWHYAGVRFSAVEDLAYADQGRPLTSYLPLQRTQDHGTLCVCCPADRGITGATIGVGTGRRTAFRSYGTSYRANAMLLSGRPPSRSSDAVQSLDRPDEQNSADVQASERGLNRNEIAAPPSRLILTGDATWYEAAEETGRDADWHGQPHAGNVLFLDGSVRFRTILPRRITNQPVVVDPFMGANPFPAADPGETPPANSSTEMKKVDDPSGHGFEQSTTQ